MEVLQKTENRTVMGSGNSPAGYSLKKMETLTVKHGCTPMLAAVSFAIAKIWNLGNQSTKQQPPRLIERTHR